MQSLRQTQFQSRPRHRAGCRRRARPAHPGGPSLVPARTIPEFIAHAKSNPGKINYGSAGIGSTLHVTGELFKITTGVDLFHVPYRGGGPAIAIFKTCYRKLQLASMMRRVYNNRFLEKE